MTRDELSRLFGVTAGAITRWATLEGMPVAEGGGAGRQARYRPSECVPWRVRQVEGRNTGVNPRDRKDNAQAELAEQRLSVLRGETIPRTEFQRLLGPVVAEIRAKLLAGPRAWAPAVARAASEHGPAGVEKALAPRIREVLTALSTLPVEGDAP